MNEYRRILYDLETSKRKAREEGDLLRLSYLHDISTH